MPRPTLLLALATAACTSAGDWFPSDVDTSDTLATAGQAAAAKVCDAFEDYLLDQYRASLFVEIACTAYGIQETADAAACGDLVQACITDPPAAIQQWVTQIVDGAGCAAIDYQPSGCGKTLSDLRTCLDAAEAELDELRRTITCALAGQSLGADALAIDAPAACLAIENACPVP